MHRRRDDGQAALEFVVALPVVAIALLAVAQIGVTVRNEIAVQHAAREGARAASVSADPSEAAASAATGATSLAVRVETQVAAGTVSVTVTHLDPTDTPIIGGAIGPVTHVASATMALEPP